MVGLAISCLESGHPSMLRREEWAAWGGVGGMGRLVGQQLPLSRLCPVAAASPQLHVAAAL